MLLLSSGLYGLKDKYIKYQVQQIGYSDKGEINKLVITDSNGNKVFELGKYVKTEPVKKAEPKDEITDDDKLLIGGVNECTTVEALEDFYKQIQPMMSGTKAKNELIKKCKERKIKLNG